MCGLEERDARRRRFNVVALDALLLINHEEPSKCQMSCNLRDLDLGPRDTRGDAPSRFSSDGDRVIESWQPFVFSSDTILVIMILLWSHSN